MPRHEGAKKTKFTLWIPDRAMADLQKLQDSTGKESIAEVVREAITVYTDLLKARDKGVDLYFHDRKKGSSGPIWILPGPPPAGSSKRVK